MLITKEQQEAMVQNYAKHHTQDEVIGFIEGMSAMLTFICEKMIQDAQNQTT